MNARGDHESFADDVGAYLLDALEPDEHAAFEEHLRGCDECRDEVVRLSVARDALPGSVDQVTPPPRLKASLMATVQAEARESTTAAKTPARRWRWRELLFARPAFAAAAAAVVLALGIAAGALVGALGGGGGDQSRTVAAQVDKLRMPAAKGSLVVPAGADRKGGAILRVEGMQQPQEGRVYEVWVKRGDKISPSSLFDVGSDGSGAAAIPDKLADADAVLVTREPEGGSKTPSEPSLVTVQLPS